jgi:hypothetical protein
MWNTAVKYERGVGVITEAAFDHCFLPRTAEKFFVHEGVGLGIYLKNCRTVRVVNRDRDSDSIAIETEVDSLVLSKGVCMQAKQSDA